MALEVNLKVNKEKGKSRLRDNNERERGSDRQHEKLRITGPNLHKAILFTVIIFWKLWKGNFILHPVDQDD